MCYALLGKNCALYSSTEGWVGVNAHMHKHTYVPDTYAHTLVLPHKEGVFSP